MSDLLKSRDGWKAEAMYYREMYEKIRKERDSLRDAIDGNVWYWQGEDDYPESLTCNIVISPQEMLKILKQPVKNFTVYNRGD